MRDALRLLCVLVSLTLVSPALGQVRGDSQADAEVIPPLTPGQKLRITLPGKKEATSLFGRTVRREEGILLGSSRSSLGIENNQSPEDTLWVAKASIVKLELSHGEEGHPWRGALYGAAFGFLGGLAAAAIETDSCQGEFLCGVSYIIFPPLGAFGGFFIGGIVGQIAKTERWVEIPESNYDLGLMIRPQTGTGLALKMRF